MLARAIAIAMLLVAPSWGAHDFNGTTDKAVANTVEASAPPFTISCWGNSDDAAKSQLILSLSDTASDNENFYVHWAGTTAGDPIRVVSDSLSGVGVATSASGYTAGTWHNTVGVFTSSTSRASFIDGGSKGTDATSSSPAGIDTTGIGLLARFTQGVFFDGKIAECGIWSVALTDAEVATLGKGFAPPCVRRNALVAYYPMIRDATSLKDLFSGTTNHLTLTGTTVSDHPPTLIRCQ